jgi:ribosomal protein S18 acetylase RimI-like enzyme
MTDLELREKSSADIRTYFAATSDEYREELIEAGNSPEEADSNIERTRSQLFDGEELAKGQYIFDVLRGQEKVGTLWLGLRSGSDWWIYDIVVDKEFRGTGLGRPTLRAAEKYVRSHGGARLGLNVFGTNAVARHLYDAAGYEVMSTQMRKELNSQ